MSKAGPARIRAKIYMASGAAGKAKMQAVGAAMRKLMQICFGVIKHQQEYRPLAT